MSQQALEAFKVAIRQSAELQQAMAATAAADVDAVAARARDAGFDVVSRDFVDHAGGALVEYEDEDYFLKASWWTLWVPSPEYTRSCAAQGGSVELPNKLLLSMLSTDWAVSTSWRWSFR